MTLQYNLVLGKLIILFGTWFCKNTQELFNISVGNIQTETKRLYVRTFKTWAWNENYVNKNQLQLYWLPDPIRRRR